jgi:hypothetical protein
MLPNSKTISLVILPIASISPHENTIPELLDSVVRDIERTGFQRDPIIVDRKTGVVLDGMHRRAALKELGARYAVCAEFDYYDRSVLLERWLRYFIAPDKKFLNELISLIRFKAAKDIRQAMSAVDARRAEIALLSKRVSYVGGVHNDILKSYWNLSKFDELASSGGVDVQFHPETDRASLFTSESVFVLYPAKLEKREVLKFAKNGDVLPFKSTRHIVPERPMGIYFPLNALIEPDIMRCKKVLKENLEGRRIDLLDKDAWYEGRRYSEPLAIFRRR